MAETLVAQPTVSSGEERPLPWLVRAKFVVIRAVLGVWLRCFGLSGLYGLGWVFGLLAWLINFRLRRRFCRRLRAVMGSEITPARALATSRRFVQRLRCDKLIYLMMDRVPADKAAERVELAGTEALDAALATGRGVHVLASHHGAQHVAGLLLARVGYDLLAVRDRNQGASRRYIQERFARTLPEARKCRWVFDDKYPLVFYRAFGEPTLVCAALDVSRVRRERQRSVGVRLFGSKQEFLCGTVHIAMRCRAPIFQIFVISLPFFRYRIEFVGPLWEAGRHPADNGPSVAQVMQRYAEGIEDFVRRYPCHMSKF